MKTRIVIALVAAAAVAVGVVALAGCSRSPRTRLLPAWQLLTDEAYTTSGVVDPFCSWAPDSRSLVFSVRTARGRQDTIYTWGIGDKGIKQVATGLSPNFVGPGEFAYLDRETKPARLMTHNLATGAEREFAPAIGKSEFWKETSAFTYDPQRKSITLRLVQDTEFYSPGTEEYDLNGKLIGEIATRGSEDVVDYSADPTGSRTALLVKESDAAPLSLQIAEGSKSRGTVVAEGRLTSVAWSPDGKMIAFGSAGEVLAARPSDGKTIVIARFADPENQTDKRYVSRLSWSPDSRYLAVMVYVPMMDADHPLIYVLDTAGLKWD